MRYKMVFFLGGVNFFLCLLNLYFYFFGQGLIASLLAAIFTFSVGVWVLVQRNKLIRLDIKHEKFLGEFRTFYD